MQETQVRSPGQKDLLEKEMTPSSRILAWRIPWTEEPGGLQCMGSQRVEHDFELNNSHREWKCILTYMLSTRVEEVAWSFALGLVSSDVKGFSRPHSGPCADGVRACFLSPIWLFSDPMDCSLSGSCVRGISQETVLEGLALSSSRVSSQLRNWTHISCVFCRGR